MIEIIHLQNFNFLGISLDISFTVHSSRAINPTSMDIIQEAFLPLAKWIGVSVALQSRVRVRVRRLVRAWHFRCCQPLSLPLSLPSLPLILYWPFGPFTHCRPAQSCCQSHSEYTTIEDWFPRSGWGAHWQVFDFGPVPNFILPLCDETHLAHTWLMYHTLWLASSCHNLPKFSLPLVKILRKY